jgi:adenine-specific DNA-methyltransferase
MAESLLDGRDQAPMHILDPCVGPGTFVDALSNTRRLLAGDSLICIDIDPAMVRRAGAALSHCRAKTECLTADYLKWRAPAPFDAAILNPPYIRQEWIDGKADLRERLSVGPSTGIPGTANLYVYFLVKSLSDLRPGGRLVAIVYDGWRHTRYGSWLSDYLYAYCETVSVQPIQRTPFRGRLIDATIISATKGTRVARERPLSALVDDPVQGIPGLVPIRERYETRRGLRLKQASFFLCPRMEAEALGGTPFLKKVRHAPGYSVSRNHPEAALLITEPSDSHPALKELRRRLALARSKPHENASILNWADQRPQSWYRHAAPPVAPIVFNYYLRGRPRHLRNPGLPFSDNFYGLQPKDGLSTLASLALLNSTAACLSILGRARNQGDGLRKLQLYEYREALVPDLTRFDSRGLALLAQLGEELASEGSSARVLEQVDEVVFASLLDPRVRLDALRDALASQLSA